MNGVYYRHEAVEVMDLDGETVILNQDTFAVTKLNGTGGFVWEALAEGQTFEQLAIRMTDAFNADQQAVSEDLSCFLNHMGDIGLIRIEE